ncbi:MAG: hypothetical protein ACRDRG_20080 [Pseudonocardiaceae bacterium]
MDQFDPNFPGLFEGEISDITVIDPVFQGNRVIDPNQEFRVKIEWRIFGTEVPTYLATADQNWDVSAYAEGIGASPEVLLGNISVSKNNSVPCGGAFCFKYEATVVVTPGTLQAHVPNSAQSGIYKIAAAVFLNSPVVGRDMIGFKEGPVIQAELL